MSVYIYTALSFIGFITIFWIFIELRKANDNSDEVFINAQGLRGLSNNVTENFNDEDRSSFISHTRTSVNHLNSSKSNIIINRIEDKPIETVNLDFKNYSVGNLAKLSSYFHVEISSINNILSEHRNYSTEAMSSSITASKEVIIARAYLQSLNIRKQEIDSLVEEITSTDQKTSHKRINTEKIEFLFRPLEFSADTVSSLISASTIPSTDLIKIRSEVKIILDRIKQSTASIRRRAA